MVASALLLVIGSVQSSFADIKPLNLEGEAGETMEASKVALRIRDAIPPVKESYSGLKRSSDYAHLKLTAEWRRLRDETARLRTVDLKSLETSASKTAFWINVYNVLVSDGIVSLKVKGSVMKSPGFFKKACYDIGGSLFTLEEIEHGILRGNRPPEVGGKPLFKPQDPRIACLVSECDPRVHFALNCGARSCPMVHVYEADKLDQQLNSAASSFINGSDVRLEESKKLIFLSQIFEWYAGDFGANSGEVLEFVARFLHEPTKSKVLASRKQLSIRYLPYDWSLVEGGQ